MQRKELEHLLSSETALALHDAWLETHGETRALEASEMWTKQAAAVRRGWELMRAGKTEPVRAEASIKNMCDGMMDMWHATMSCGVCLLSCTC